MAPRVPPTLRKVALVVPAHNEAERIAATLKRLPPDTAELLFVVDDGSTDRTAEAAREAGKDARVLSHPTRRGYGAALRTGLQAARDAGARAVAVLHADGQYPPEEVPSLLRALASGADVASGVRIHGRGYPLHRAVGERVLDRLLSRRVAKRGAGGRPRWPGRRARRGLRSFSSGFRAYGPRALEAIPWDALPEGYGFDAGALLFAARLGLQIEEIPVPHSAGPSDLRPWGYAQEVLRWARAHEGRQCPGETRGFPRGPARDFSPELVRETAPDSAWPAQSPRATSRGPGPPGGGPF